MKTRRKPQLSTVTGALLTVAVLSVATVGEYFTGMAQKHAYEERWPRIRAALDGMIGDREAELADAAPFRGMSDTQRAALLSARTNAWIARARGMSPQAPIPATVD